MDISQTFIALLCCIGMRVASVLSNYVFRLRDLLLCVLFESFCYDLRDGGAPHTSTFVRGLAGHDAYSCQRTCRSRPSVVFSKVMIIWVGNLHACGHLSLVEYG